MHENTEKPQDQRMLQIRSRIGKVGEELDAIRQFVDGLPDPFREEVKGQMLRAFQAGQELSRLDSVPDTPPVDEAGALRIGPELREHILATRKIYGDLSDLREAAEDIFDQQTGALLQRLVRQESINETISTDFKLAA